MSFKTGSAASNVVIKGPNRTDESAVKEYKSM